MNSKKTVFALLCACSAWSASAQDYVFPEVKDHNKTVRELFEVKDYDLKHHFTIATGKGSYLVFEMERLSAWKGKEDFFRYTETILPVLAQYRDSLTRRPMSTKRLDIHIPVQNTPLISRFSEHMINSNLQALNDKETVALKMTLDTLRIVKKFEDRKIQGEQVPEHFQYTFFVKNLADVKELLADKSWLNHSAGLIDSVVTAYRKEWRSQDAWFHHLFVSYDPSRSTKKQLLVTRQLSEQNGVNTQDMISFSAGFGAGLVRNTICPTADIGLQLTFYSDHESTFFTRLSMNSFTRFEEQTGQRFKAYATTFVNAELGFGVNRSNTKLKPYSLSMGFGYKLLNKHQADRDPSLPRYLYRLFFNYDLGKGIVITPEFYSDFASKATTRGWGGLSVTFRLFE
ncbi:MAG: hypothetical protein JNL13_05135 [Chitinophagaceae bacterium]|nr:hypothetical protein [Chitinophagaceae bacterium]